MITSQTNALGYTTDESILRAFYRVSKISIKDKKLFWNVDEGLTGLKLSYAINTRSGDTVVGQGKKITSTLFKEIQKAKIQQVEVAANDGEARRSHWIVVVTGYRPCTMIGEPMTDTEALAEARMRWPGAKVE